MIQLGYFTMDTENVEKARAFYSALFGWTFDEAESHPNYAHVAGGQPSFGFTKVERAKDTPHLYFRVDDVERLCARVVELGGKAAIPSETPSGITAVVCDDQGVSFSLWQPAPGF
ncbi:MAG: VOC family protein [Brevundimonas sp.]|uniref:VOC family protein n=1 Tax=Brevundimonas sp. TaxID=1871086 RepID=UPI00272429A0|nr:VOC family protein [Brevundimonas sp.]MDO9076722.1 VOC family protein [Brevundimonas sp.]MDP3080414.1 VOC family protein [Brevundimonas sp.]MDZ4061901.1 VOC family protein [Brevundimonas sp.]